MSNGVLEGLLFFLMLFTLLTGVPIAYSLGISSIIIMVLMEIPMSAAVHALEVPLRSYVLLAIPFFILVSALMNSTRITHGLVDFVDRSVGRIRGSIGYVAVLTSMIFAGMTGSANADAAAIGKIFIPAMQEKGFTKEFAVALTTVSGTIGGIIPPSITMIIWAAFTDTSVGGLFLGGIIPGLLVGFAFMAAVWYRARKDNVPMGEPSSWQERRDSFIRTLPLFPVPIIILGGIVLGLFTPTESGAAAILYIVIIALVLRRLTAKSILEALGESLQLLGPIYFSIMNAVLFGWVLSYLDFASSLESLIGWFGVSATGFLIFVVLLFLILGTFMSTVEMIVIFAPTIAVIARDLGIDPIFLGVIASMTMLVGLATPPYGLCLMIESNIAGIPIMRAFARTIPLILVEVTVILFLVFFPGLITWLPEALMPTG